MDYLKTVLIANRGEIACRLIRAAKSLNLHTIAVYSQVDSESLHALSADEAHLLTGDARSAYLDGDQIIAVAKTHGAQAIVPGYGFLSEHTDFAHAVAAAGLVFVGPSPEAVQSFGLKHRARALAVAAGVPVVPGTPGLVDTEEAAVEAANGLGYPVMLKATAGGGGMGLLVCGDAEEVRRHFQTVQSRGTSLFKNGGVFVERYYPDSHHIEVQVFGNGQGRAVSLGERECSIQRRHQKVIEECPSPFVAERHPELRATLTACAVRLAESIRYGSAGTVEFLVDDHTGDFFFLEMNTRLQVEHGITEMCYDVDLVALMLQQADAELGGTGGLPAATLDELQARCVAPQGHAIEARVYAENPARHYAPSPGLLQQVDWHQPPGTRIDTWVQTGMTISADYDPLLAKVLFHGETRAAAVAGIDAVLAQSAIRGPPVNIDLLLTIVRDDAFRRGHTVTKFLDTFSFTPAAIDVVAGGAYTLVQDYPGRPSVGHGFGHAGPMDTIAFRAANLLVGNDEGTEGLEITLSGPDLHFLGAAVVAVCGPPIPATLDGQPFPLWTRVRIEAGQRLTLGKMEAHCRVYLAVYGGFPSVASWFGSKSTNPMVSVGGYQGRPLRAGDFLRLVEDGLPPNLPLSVPEAFRPPYTSEWHVEVMAGPYETGYLSEADVDMVYGTAWKISHNAARGGIRLVGPRPVFARSDGGEGGGHPSNVIEYGYPLGGLDWTGDEAVIFPADCPDFGGFICSLTVTKGDLWKVGQLRAGDRVQFHRVTLDSALATRRRNEAYLAGLAAAVQSVDGQTGLVPFVSTLAPEAAPGQDLIRYLAATDHRPAVSYRAGGDDYVLVDYGDGRSDLNHKCRATALKRALEAASGVVSADRGQGGAIYNTVGCGNSLAIFYDGLRVEREGLLSRLVALEATLGDMSATQFPNRHVRLPLTFRHRKLEEALERYMANQRPTAAYLPDPLRFVAENNGMTVEALKQMVVRMESVVIGVGFFMALPLCLPVDPRDRIRAPKMNPSRTYTPEGTFSYGGSAIAVYPVDSPGGYMVMGMTIPGLDVFGRKAGFGPERPWLFEDMDSVSFYEVTEAEYDEHMAAFKAGRYQFDMAPGVFDMAAHNRLLAETTDEARQLQATRAVAQDAMAVREKALLGEWLAEKQASEVRPDEIEALLEDPHVHVVEAPVNANVWKVLVQEGQVLANAQTVAILEAMKMEINVDVPPKLAGATVVKALAKPGDSIESGAKLFLVKLEIETLH